ncbi:MAG TPA: ATP-binding cassette domain-containing protein, partial [Mycobacteriales bacterium]|nr:ATP-binding cassette domain-containing protein [Mycobacteriales bacterium]
VAHVGYTLPDGRMLLNDVSFRVGEGSKTALIGANGAGKTTLLRIVAGDLDPDTGTVARSGGLGVMRQFIGSVGDTTTVRELLLSLAAPAQRAAGERLAAAERRVARADDEAAQLTYADALTDWGDTGGYELEVRWDTATVAAIDQPFTAAAGRPVRELSGGEQKRLALEALLRGPDEVLLLDEPDNYLDVPGKRWLERRLAETEKTVLFVSHDRELLARSAGRIVTVEAQSAWVHGGGFATYHQAREERNARFDELLLRWNEEHKRLKELVRTLQQQAKISDVMASKYRATQTRLRKYEEAGPPPEPPRDQKVTVRLEGGRTGVRALTCSALELHGLTEKFDFEVFYGERIAVLGANGSGKSHFLRLLNGDPVSHSGTFKLGARVVPGHFAQTHEHPQFLGKSLVDILWHGEGGRRGLDRGRSIGALRRYELQQQADQLFETLSGGQQARFQILLLELSGATMLLLDEPTDNLDLASAEALQDGLAGFQGTVLAVTHDRWFARGFDRYLHFGADCAVAEVPEPVWA